ncbi:anti-sigma regulatory factor (Ser/Thr protein kinase) [Alkalibacillus flavidus]|uniref:Anti-sigma regulatory factor (Ser/Thr protein kinase) n=1 Tax=Alkalibacillus flavidus TaxID=546021 RepID=A0ABV2KWI4_9BACI
MFRVRDEGQGFDVDKRLNELYEVSKLPIEEQFDHGRGLLLIDQIMDDIAFSRTGNELLMRKWQSHETDRE